MPRFSLRTLFVVVTLIAVALGGVMWQRGIVRERREFLNTLLQQRVRYLTVILSKDGMKACAMAEDGQERRTTILPGADLALGREALGPWSLRRWLGDVTIARVWIYRSTPPEVVALAKKLAPEAAISLPGDPWIILP